MPVVVRKLGNSDSPYKIVELRTGKVVGSASNRKNAEASARARNTAYAQKRGKK